MFRWTIGFLALLLTKWEKELSERLPWARGGMWRATQSKIKLGA